MITHLISREFTDRELVGKKMQRTDYAKWKRNCAEAEKKAKELKQCRAA